MKSRLCQVVFFLLICVVAFAGCGTNQSADKQKEDGKFKIVTSFYPMYVATINITKGIDGVEVKNMTKPQTGCLHDYQLTPADLKTLEKANAFVVNGAGMEAFLDKVVKQQEKLKIIDASKEIDLLKDGTEDNPHVWVSITNAIKQVRNIEEQLSAADPKHADQYKENADAYAAKLENLKQDMHAAVDSLPNKNIVTFHEAFPYFAKEFNLNIVAVIEREPGSDPTPKDIEETVDKVKSLNIKALFVEPQYPEGAAQTISKESGAKVYTLDPVVTGDADENAADAYINVMKKNAQVLQEALQ